MFKFLLTTLIIILITISCNNENTESKDPKILSQKYCGGCHLLPNPKDLDKKSWEKVFPLMGNFLGIYQNELKRDSLIATNDPENKEKYNSIFPKNNLINPEDFEIIKKYYFDNSSDSILKLEKPKIIKGLPNFEVIKPQSRFSPPSTTLIKFLEDGLIFGDANTQAIAFFDKNFNPLKQGKVAEGAVNAIEDSKNLIITLMGSFSPTDEKTGFLLLLPKDSTKQPFVVVDSLRRPVHSLISDLNYDGLDDFVICEFGNRIGGLTYKMNLGNGYFKSIKLRDQPGAISSQVIDYNKDGFLDIVALFGQGDEGIFLFLNDGKGNFKEKVLLRFPPSYGSSSFDLIDYNQDNFIDIIYTNGDNADFRPVLKKNHGIRIFTGKENYEFKQELFYQLNGAYSAKVRDFDLDGDLDISAISFFPDFESNPMEAFVFLQNDGKNKFTAYGLEDPLIGRFIVMDVIDYDKDGDEDLALGSLTFEVITSDRFVKRWIDEAVPFIIIKNNIK